MAAVTVFQQQHRALMVKNLRPGLTECGKIKIGRKGQMVRSRQGNDFQPPQKLDHFVITTLDRGEDGNYLRDGALHKRFGDKPREIPVRLLFNDPWLSFQTSYVAFNGSKRFCTGDGERAEQMTRSGLQEVACPCNRIEPSYEGTDRCKINGTLSVLIDGAEVVGGVWKLRTTSINTCQGIASSLAFLSSATGGQIAGVPLTLTIRPKAAITPQGQATTVYVVGLEFRGTIDNLRDLAHRQALSDAQFGMRMARIEEDARLLLTGPAVSDAEAVEVVEEFYPDAAVVMHESSEQPVEASIATEPRSAAPQEAELIEIYNAFGEPFAKPPGEAEAFLLDQVNEITDIEQLKDFIEANRGSPAVTRAVGEACNALAAKLSPGQKVAQEPASVPEKPQEAASNDGDPGPSEEAYGAPAAAPDGGVHLVFWPGVADPERLQLDQIKNRLLRRLRTMSTSEVAEFKKKNTELVKLLPTSIWPRS